MAVTRIATPNHYVGVAADPKPTSDVPAGSLFFERDTGLTFIYDGTAWGALTDIWAAATRTLTGFTGQPRTDLVGSDAALWAHATRTLTGFTGQPRTDLVGSDAALWAHATRTLSAFAVESLLNPAINQTVYPLTTSTSSGTADTFGSWTQILANVGNGKWLHGVILTDGEFATRSMEIELGEGGVGAEAAIARTSWRPGAASLAGAAQQIFVPFWKALTNGARLSVRTRDNGAIARETLIQALVT